ALSAVFRKYEKIHASGVSLSLLIEGRYYINSEGTEIYEPRMLLALSASAETQAEDNAPLYDKITFFARTPEELPDQETLTKSIQALAEDLQKMREAKPLEEDYSGPV